MRIETVDNNISADDESVPAHVPNYDLKSVASAVQKYMLFEIHDGKDDTSNRSSVMTSVFLRIYSNIFCNSQKSDIYENQMYVRQNNVSVDQWTVKSSLNFTFENSYIVDVSGCLNKAFVTTNQTIKVRWLNINIAHYGHLEELQPKKCSVFLNRYNRRYCLVFRPLLNKSKTTYYLFRDVFYQESDRIMTSPLRKTWIEALELCRTVGDFLPFFRSREELEELLMLIRLSPYLPTIDGIFIGLFFNTRKVRMYTFLGLKLTNTEGEIKSIPIVRYGGGPLSLL